MIETGNFAWEVVELAPDGRRLLRPGILVITRQHGGMMVWQWIGALQVHPPVKLTLMRREHPSLQ